MSLAKSRTPRLIHCFRRMLPVVLMVSLPVCGTADDALALLIADWESREARFKTAYIDFQSTEIYPPGMTVGRNGGGNLRTVEHVLEHQIIFDERRGRFTRDGPTIDMNTNTIVFEYYTSTFDGRDSYQLHNGSHLEGRPSGKIYTTRGSILGRGWDYHSAPIFMAFRPLTKTLEGVDPKDWGPPKNVLVNGIKASAYTVGVFDYIVDPSREHVVIRIDYFRHRDGQSRDLFIRLDIQYKTMERFGHVPDTWSLTEIAPSSGKTMMKIEGRAVKCEFNQPVSHECFIIDFPVGTVVHDNRRQVKALVQGDGSYKVLHRSGK